MEWNVTNLNGIREAVQLARGRAKDRHLLNRIFVTL